ncbi:MAG: galactokinase [Treponema sp.]|jgi:galactokinase|nr:galactokinase [Treponema sp.]
MTGKELLEKIDSPAGGALFAELYGEKEVSFARQRYRALIEEITGGGFPRAELDRADGNLRVFSAPGRTELGGNHTDHNRGKVLAASIQLDSAAIVCARNDKAVFFRSAGYPDVRVNLAHTGGAPDLEPRTEEQGTTGALVRGIAAELDRRGTEIGGFSANAASTVLPGSGLSSSAAVEVLFGRVFDCLYAGGKRSALEIAQIGQIAENTFFGKPCGLMDQTACATGGAVAINFADAAKPEVRHINFDLAALGFTLCVVNTRGSHADLTPDYAAIPAEMKAAAAFFGKSVLGELDRETVLAGAAGLRKAAGDRALLRALHFFDENERVDAMAAALDSMDRAAGPEKKQRALDGFLELVNESGDSSWELLQNVYSTRNSAVQGVSVALGLSKNFFRRQNLPGACRVHGGGFAGTIQVYLPPDALAAYSRTIETVFGPGSVTPLRIRPLGSVELNFSA